MKSQKKQLIQIELAAFLWRALEDSNSRPSDP
jgi:hypothetical protein